MTRLPDASVYLVPLGRNHYELYTEPSDEPATEPDHASGFFRQRIHRLRESWHEAVQGARRSEAVGRWARLRDWVVCRAAETIAEQRTLWSLRHVALAQMSYPSDLSDTEATGIRVRLLADARRHHGIWVVIDGLLFAASGLLMLVPGPNVFAYYFGLRLVGHYLSWRGARHALDHTAWETHAEPALAELRQLAGVPRESRTRRVEAIANGLNLPRLAAFFDRVAV
jgi:hypothetical protein